MDRAVGGLADEAADETQRFMAELSPSAGEAATAPILGPRLHTDLFQHWLGLARESGNAFGLNRRGYLYVTAERDRLAALQAGAERSAGFGSGPVRVHRASGQPASPCRTPSHAPSRRDWRCLASRPLRSCRPRPCS